MSIYIFFIYNNNNIDNNNNSKLQNYCLCLLFLINLKIIKYGFFVLYHKFNEIFTMD